MPASTFIDVGPTIDLSTSSSLNSSDFNFVLVHRHYDPLVQKWGNLCSKVVSSIVSRDAYDMPIRWYHVALFKFCYNQYDKYGDYFRILDNSFGNKESDQVIEVE